jgi:FAD:protein FMN transferase
MRIQTSVSPVLALLLVLSFGACATPRQALERYEFEEPQMGVPFRIILYAPNESQAKTAATAAFHRVAELNQKLSDYETDSELNELSRAAATGKKVPVSNDLWTVLAAAQDLALESGGAFDITVGPCVSLWRNARREQKLPDPARLERARARVGYTHLTLDAKSKTAILDLPTMRLDLGGIAKGFAADEALKSLRTHGITRALVAGSGDVTVGDPPPHKKGWRVELTGYDRPGGPPAEFVTVRNASIATSGDIFQKLEIEGVRYSHILDPFTCIGLTNVSLVSVIAETGLKADPLATTLCILPPAEALAFAEKKKIAARIVQQTSTGLVVQESSRLKKLLKNSAQ